MRVETSLGPVALLELLELLFRFTFLLVRPHPLAHSFIHSPLSCAAGWSTPPDTQESTEAFQSCLRTWSIFLTYLTDRAEDRKRATATTADPHASELPELRYRAAGGRAAPAAHDAHTSGCSAWSTGTGKGSWPFCASS